MTFEHACFISFPNDAGNATTFAQCFFEELQGHLAPYDKDLSIFKWDCREDRRRGDAWATWIGRELCRSAMMVAICPPAYFNSSEGCVSEFDGMENLAASRSEMLACCVGDMDWIIGVRLKEKAELPRLKPDYGVIDFFECASTPKDVRRLKRNRQKVEQLADRIWRHWQSIDRHANRVALENAQLCKQFLLSRVDMTKPDAFPQLGAAR
ncbi:MAG: hypothetical protein ABI831_01175 [Betaproteobacteria bacterium]